MSLLLKTAAVLLYTSSIAWVYLYLYPVWLGCGFPQVQYESEPRRPPLQFPFFQHDEAREAPFRLLVLADPQLEGDSSLPKLRWSPSGLKPAALAENVKQTGRYVRKKLDLWGNDRYLAHIYRSLQTFTHPTHVTVLGDLLGSQWISDEEFGRRADRYWNVVFAGSQAVPDYLTRQPLKETLGKDASWKTRVINIAGNHDIGYAGDMTEERVERFERRFGRSNWELEFELPRKEQERAADISQGKLPPSIRILVLNSMNLDPPVRVQRLQDETYASLNGFITRSRTLEDSSNVLTVVLSHVPLHKRSGMCADGPLIRYYSQDDGEGMGVMEQNHLSQDTSRQLLQGIFGMGEHGKGRNGVILNGHDHEGCDVWHFLPSPALTEGDASFAEHKWNATRWHLRRETEAAAGVPGLREITLRAMMGEYDGNAALFSAWYDEEAGRWGYDVMNCAAGPQHIWWAVHILFLVTSCVGAVALYKWQSQSIKAQTEKKRQARAEQKARKTSRPRP